MNYKIEKTLKKSKNVFIVFGILWVALSIVFVSPIAVSVVESKVDRNVQHGSIYR